MFVCLHKLEPWSHDPKSRFRKSRGNGFESKGNKKMYSVSFRLLSSLPSERHRRSIFHQNQDKRAVPSRWISAVDPARSIRRRELPCSANNSRERKLFGSWRTVSCCRFVQDRCLSEQNEEYSVKVSWSVKMVGENNYFRIIIRSKVLIQTYHHSRSPYHEILSREC